MANKMNSYLSLSERPQNKRLVLNNTRQYQSKNFIRPNLTNIKRQYNYQQQSPKLKPSKFQRTSYFNQHRKDGGTNLINGTNKQISISNHHSRQKIKSHHSQMPYKNIRFYDQDMIPDQKKAMNSLYLSHDCNMRRVQLKDLQKRKTQRSIQQSNKGQLFLGRLDDYISQLTFQKDKSKSKHSSSQLQKQQQFAFVRKTQKYAQYEQYSPKGIPQSPKKLKHQDKSNEYVRNLRAMDRHIHQKYLGQEFIKQKVNNVLLLKQLQAYRERQSQSQKRIQNLENNIQTVMQQIMHLNNILDQQDQKRWPQQSNFFSNSYQQLGSRNYHEQLNRIRAIPHQSTNAKGDTFRPSTQTIDSFQQQYCLHMQQKFGSSYRKVNLNSLRSMRK